MPIKGASRLIVQENNEGLPEGMRRYYIVGTLIVEGEKRLPSVPGGHPIIVDLADPELLLLALMNPKSHFTSEEFLVDGQKYPYDMRTMTFTELMTFLGKYVLKRFKPS